MSLTTREQDSVTILNWQGPLGVDNHLVFKEAVQSLIDNKKHQFVLDLSNVTFIDSTGLGVMTALLRRLKQSGGDLVLVNLQAEVKPIFEITGLKKIFTIASNLEAALAHF